MLDLIKYLNLISPFGNDLAQAGRDCPTQSFIFQAGFLRLN